MRLKTPFLIATASVLLCIGVSVSSANASQPKSSPAVSSVSGPISNGYNYCLGVNKRKIVNVKCVEKKNSWTVSKSSRSAGYQIGTKNCVTAAVLRDGENLQLASCGKVPAAQQDWVALPSGGIALVGSNFCLDVEVGVPKPNSPIQIYTCQGLTAESKRIPSQRWGYNPAMFGVGKEVAPVATTVAPVVTIARPNRDFSDMFPGLPAPPTITSEIAPQPPIGGPDCDPYLRSSTYKRTSSPAYIFIGVRGSSEKTTDTLRSDKKGTGMGARMEFLYDQIRKDPKYKSILCTGPLAPSPPGSLVDIYPAMEMPAFDSEKKIVDYIGEVALNYILLSSLVRDIAVRNPSSRLIVAGYSQGAAIVHAGISDFITNYPNLKSRIANVILIANPLAFSDDPNILPSGVSGKDTINWTTSLGLVPIATSVIGKGGSRSALTLAAISLIASILDNPVTRNCELNPCQSARAIGQKAKIVVSAGIQLAGNFGSSWSNLLSANQIKSQGINVLSVCKWGDAVCSPAGNTDKYKIPPFGPSIKIPGNSPKWFHGETHSNAYGNLRAGNGKVAAGVIFSMRP